MLRNLRSSCKMLPWDLNLVICSLPKEEALNHSKTLKSISLTSKTLHSFNSSSNLQLQSQTIIQSCPVVNRPGTNKTAEYKFLKSNKKWISCSSAIINKPQWWSTDIILGVLGKWHWRTCEKMWVNRKILEQLERKKWRKWKWSNGKSESTVW